MDNKSVLVKERNVGFDVLKIIASFAVMVIHIVGESWDKATELSSFQWNVLNVYNSGVRWAVPIFVMVSGALFLSANHSVEKMYKKYILRIACAFVFWSAVYAAFVFIKERSVKGAAVTFITGYYHLWFLFMIIGLYMITPLLKKLTEDEKLTKYFVILAFIFASLLPELLVILNHFSGSAAKYLNADIANFHLDFVLGYSLYFVIGFLISKTKLTKKQFGLLALGGIIGFISTAVLTMLLDNANKPSKVFYGYLTVNVFFEAIFIFSLYQKINEHSFSEKTKKIIFAFSKYSFGAYLVHLLFVKAIYSIPSLNPTSFNPIISVPVTAIIVFVFSYIASAVINQIPIIKKYIV